MIGFMKNIVTQIRSDPKSWAVETTTMLGIALIAGAAWFVITGKISLDQASGLVVIGTGLLYPQNGNKQQQTQKAVLTGLGVLQALHTHHEAVPVTQDPIKSEDKKT